VSTKCGRSDIPTPARKGHGMKQTVAVILILSALSIGVVSTYAGEYPTIALGSSVTGTIITNAGETHYSGYLDSVLVEVAGSGVAYTGTLVVASAKDTFLTTDAFSTSTRLRPVYGTVNVAGATTSLLQRAYLAGEKLIFTLTATSTNAAKTVSVTVRTADR